MKNLIKKLKNMKKKEIIYWSNQKFHKNIKNKWKKWKLKWQN